MEKVSGSHLNTDGWWHFGCDVVTYVPCPCSNLNLPALCLGYLRTPGSELGSSYSRSSTKGLKSARQTPGWTSGDRGFSAPHSTFLAELAAGRWRQGCGRTGLLKESRGQGRVHETSGAQAVLWSGASSKIALPSPFRVFEETKK